MGAAFLPLLLPSLLPASLPRASFILSNCEQQRRTRTTLRGTGPGLELVGWYLVACLPAAVVGTPHAVRAAPLLASLSVPLLACLLCCLVEFS